MERDPISGGREALSALVEEISSPAEHARLHRPAPDGGDRMGALAAEREAGIAAARRVEATMEPTSPPAV